MSFYAVFSTTAGWMGIQISSRGIQRVIIPRQSAQEIHELLNDAQEKPDIGLDLQKRLQGYFAGKPADFNDKLDFSRATEFQRKVWQATQSIPYGQTRSYSWIATEIGKPKAVRAAGQALGKNPFPVIVPCHRVVASDGSLGGFSDGIPMKLRLLELEGTIFEK